MVLREAWMQRDVHIAMDRADRARLAGKYGRGAALDGIGIEFAIAHDAQLAAALREQHLPGGQPCQSIGIFDIAQQYGDANVLLLGGPVEEWALAQRLLGKAGWGNRYAVGEWYVLLGRRRNRNA